MSINPRRSARHTGKFIQALSIGSDPASFISGVRPASEKDLNYLVDNIDQGGIYTISMPVPPFKHAFLVNITDDKIMICDWKGSNQLKDAQYQQHRFNNGEIKNFDKEARWVEYSVLMQKLTEKFGKSIEYYPIIPQLKKICQKYNDDETKSGGYGGGCAEYLYKWIEINKDML